MSRSNRSNFHSSSILSNAGTQLFGSRPNTAVTKPVRQPVTTPALDLSRLSLEEDSKTTSTAPKAPLLTARTNTNNISPLALSEPSSTERVQSFVKLNEKNKAADDAKSASRPLEKILSVEKAQQRHTRRNSAPHIFTFLNGLQKPITSSTISSNSQYRPTTAPVSRQKIIKL